MGAFLDNRPILAGIILISGLMVYLMDISSLFENTIPGIIVLGITFVFYTTCILAMGIWIKLLLNYNIILSAIIMLILTPLFGMIIEIVINILMIPFYTVLNDDEVGALCTGLSASFAITFISMAIGSFIEPVSYLPQTLQMLIVNVICDGLTLYITYRLLKGAINTNSILSIPFAIALDIFAAAILACFSLYYGLIGSKHALNSLQIFGILLGQPLGGVSHGFGPCFWTMHTTFLPTTIYMLFILFTWGCKLIVLPLFHLFYKGGEIEKPHHLTAAAFGLISLIFFIIDQALRKLK